MNRRLLLLLVVLGASIASATTTSFPTPPTPTCTVSAANDRLIVAPGGGSGGQLHYAAQWLGNVNGTPESTRLILQWDVAGQTGGMLVAIKSTTDSGTDGWIYGVNFTWSGGVTNNRAYFLNISWANQTVQIGPEINGLSGTPPTPSAIVFSGDSDYLLQNQGVAVVIQERVNVVDSFEIRTGISCTPYNGSGRYKSGSASDTNLTDRYYGVSAGNGAFPLNTTTFDVPSAPQNLTATMSANVTLEWDVPLSDGGAAVSNYKIYRSTDNATFSLHATIGTNRSFVDENVVKDVSYYYCVVAVNSAGDSPCSNVAEVISRSLFGDFGLLWGGVGAESVAASLGTTVRGIKALYSIFFLAVFYCAGWLLSLVIPRGIAFVITIAPGIGFCVVIGLLPLFVPIYVGAATLAVALERRRRTRMV